MNVIRLLLIIFLLLAVAGANLRERRQPIRRIFQRSAGGPRGNKRTWRTSSSNSRKAVRPQHRQVLLGEVDQLASEIVDSIVQRLEADEALAVELEKRGIDPDYNSQS